MLLDWKKLALNIYDTLKKEVKKSKQKIVLWAILVWNNEASLRYIKQKRKWAEYIWIWFELLHLEEEISEKKLLENIKYFNEKKEISWFIVQLPLPKHINENTIIEAINPSKDVDWFHPVNQWKMLIWDKSWFVPCTPAWIMEFFKQEKISFAWKDITVIWRSNIVWKPMAILLINAWATVTSCNSKTKNLEKITKKSDIIIVATWNPGLLNKNMIKKDSIIIDVGFSVIDWKIYWDCKTDEIDDFWAKITPVPGWVWALTVCMLMKNTLKSANINI